jgi:hypothetical protein
MLKLFFSFILGFTIAYIYEFGGKYLAKLLFDDDNLGLIIYGYRFHHSLYGLLAFFLASKNKDWFWIGFGLGIIAQHTYFGRFEFISKEP